VNSPALLHPPQQCPGGGHDGDAAHRDEHRLTDQPLGGRARGPAAPQDAEGQQDRAGEQFGWHHRRHRGIVPHRSVT
jgi:hypothetical protein